MLVGGEQFLMRINAHLHGETHDYLLRKLSRCFHTRGQIYCERVNVHNTYQGGHRTGRVG